MDLLSHPRKVLSMNMIVVMGPTGTGKSAFIDLLTGDSGIHIGHDLESFTLDINTSRYVDPDTGLSVRLVDTPGFDDSRSGVTDIDILAKIANFLQANGGRRVNGIIYLHRISDPRMGGVAKKNLRMFRELCGDDSLGNVRIVTTYWGVVDNDEGSSLEAALAKGPFKALKMLRHDKGLESARSIVSGLVQQMPVTLKLQKELAAGKALGDTSAGRIILEEMREMEKRHAKEMAELMKEMEEAKDDDLKAELAEERRKLSEEMSRMEKDQKRLEVMRIEPITCAINPQGGVVANQATPLKPHESKSKLSGAMHSVRRQHEIRIASSHGQDLAHHPQRVDWRTQERAVGQLSIALAVIPIVLIFLMNL